MHASEQILHIKIYKFCFIGFFLSLSGQKTGHQTVFLYFSGADILVSVVAMPFIAYTTVVGEWRLQTELCQFVGFITMLTFVASVMSLAMISINRYVIICHPSMVEQRYTRKKTVLWIAGEGIFRIP